MRKRSRAREVALQILYQVDLRRSAEDLEEMFDSAETPPDILEFARSLVTGTLARREDADRRISEVAEHWDIHRMAVIDRNVLRMAVHEMLDREDIPRKVSINEAIELGKKFSTENSGGFINGILDRIRRTIEENRSCG